MKPTRGALLLAGLLALPAAPALAHDTTAIDRAQARQLHQIEEARRTGALTRRELEARVAEQARIAEMERRARANGVTGREYRAIREAQRRADANIAADASNGRVNLWRKLRTRHGG
jgi:hypothetical protein